jgi:L-rhamnose mutarotase
MAHPDRGSYGQTGLPGARRRTTMMKSRNSLPRSPCAIWIASDDEGYCIGMAQRYGAVVGVKADQLAEYKRLHAAVWPAVLATIERANIRNFSIYLRKLPDGKHYLFSYFEYVGADYAGDMAAVAADPDTQRWWAITEPCQEPLGDRADGEWWASAEEVFHTD